MIRHHYVRVWITEAGALLLTDGQRDAIRGAMASLNIPWNGVQPAFLFQARLSLEGDQAIYELTYDDATTPEQAFGAAAAALGMSGETLAAVIGYQIFGGPEADQATSAAAARSYLAANRADWEPDLETTYPG